MWNSIFLCFISLCAGLMSAGGVITVLLTVGLVPRFAGKTHTADKVFLYENFVVAGTIAGCIVSVFDEEIQLGQFLLGNGLVSEKAWLVVGNAILFIGGIFAGIFVGSLAMAIAEMLDSIPIFARRIGFRHGLGIVILASALGKFAGSFWYFANGMYTK